MSFETGVFTDVSDANSIADPIVAVAASAVKLPINKGKIWNDLVPFIEQESNRKFDIYSRTETQRSGAVGNNWTDGTTATGLLVASTVGLIKGLVLKIEEEVVVVKTVVDATTIDVVKRGAAGTTGAVHADTTAYSVIGSAINDVDLKDIDSVSEITNVYNNFMQTVAEPIDFTKGGQLDPRKGLSAAQMQILQEEAMRRVAVNISASTVLGLKQQKSGNSPYMTAGLIQQLTDTTDGRLTLEYSTTGLLDETKLKAALRLVTATGTPTDIYVSSANKDIINEFLGSTSAAKLSMNTDINNTTAGYYVDSYNYEGLLLNVKIDLDMPDDKIAIVNINKCYKGWKLNDSLEYHDEGKVSSREFRASFNGSYGVAIEDVGYEHIIMTGVTQA
jgi:hypothetical protein